MALLVFSLQGLTLLYFLKTRKFFFLASLCLFQASQITLPLFYDGFHAIEVKFWNVSQASLVLLLSTLSLWVGTLLISQFWKPIPVKPKPLSTDRGFAPIIFATLVGFSVLLLPLSATRSVAFRMALDLSLLWLILSISITSLNRIILSGIPIALLCLVYYAGSLSIQLFLTTVQWIILFCLCDRQFKRAWVLGPIILLALTSNYLKPHLRGLIPENAQEIRLPREMITEVFKERRETLLESGDPIWNFLQPSLKRYTDTSLLRVALLTPDVIPFWKGKTYQDILWRFIPRQFRGGHELFSPWNEFGRVYQITKDFDFDTSVSFNFVTEAYMNGGIWVVCGVGIFLGVLFVALENTIMSGYLGTPLVALGVLAIRMTVDPVSLGTLLHTTWIWIIALFAFRHMTKGYVKITSP